MLASYQKIIFLFAFITYAVLGFTHFKAKEVYWADNGIFYNIKDGSIYKTDITSGKETLIIDKNNLTPHNSNIPLSFEIYTFSNDKSKILLFTNTAKVWRYNTRGDYWIYDLRNKTLTQIGKSRPAQSLMYAKLSSDGSKVAYVCQHNIFVEDLISHQEKQLTKDGSRKLINGTFDWVYEEELGCRDGLRWSDDGKFIAFWQVDATKIRDYYMVNTTDSVYSHIIPVEYPKVGQSPSPVKIGTINVQSGIIKWMNIPGAPNQHYLPRMEWAHNSTELVVQQLNRKQNESKLF